MKEQHIKQGIVVKGDGGIMENENGYNQDVLHEYVLKDESRPYYNKDRVYLVSIIGHSDPWDEIECVVQIVAKREGLFNYSVARHGRGRIQPVTTKPVRTYFESTAIATAKKLTLETLADMKSLGISVGDGS